MRKDTVEISEPTKPIDIPSVQENNGRIFTFVVIGDLDSVKGSEEVHSGSSSYSRVRSCHVGKATIDLEQGLYRSILLRP